MPRGSGPWSCTPAATPWTRWGWLIDLPELEKAGHKVADAKKASADQRGVGLTANSNATRAWAAERGIGARVHDGKETLSAKFYRQAVVPRVRRSTVPDTGVSRSR